MNEAFQREFKFLFEIIVHLMKLIDMDAKPFGQKLRLSIHFTELLIISALFDA